MEEVTQETMISIHETLMGLISLLVGNLTSHLGCQYQYFLVSGGMNNTFLIKIFCFKDKIKEIPRPFLKSYQKSSE